jgi:hypothetical protein
LVHELGHKKPKTTKELLDIATRHAFDEEAVGAIFIQNSRKVDPTGGRGGQLKASGDKGAKTSTKSDKRGLKRWPQ